MQPMGSLISDLREIKTEEEVACCVKAQRIAERALAETLNDIHAGVTEKHIASLLEFRMLDYGGEKMSFDPIVVSCKKSSMPHGVPSEKIIEDGDFVTMDFGCTYEGYCSDMTRSFFYGEPTEHQRAVYECVLHANEAAEAIVRPGVTFAEIDRAARKVIEDAGWGQYFTHRLGHQIGLEDHEPGDVSSAHDDPVRPGQCFSIEPGVYLPGDVGVRIEDLVIVTEDGCEVLNSYPKGLTVLK